MAAQPNLTQRMTGIPQIWKGMNSNQPGHWRRTACRRKKAPRRGHAPQTAAGESVRYSVAAKSRSMASATATEASRTWVRHVGELATVMNKARRAGTGGEMHEPDRLARRGAAGSGDAGDRHR